MRQTLVDLSRERLTIKRGQDRRDLDLDRLEDLLPNGGGSILALKDTLLALAEFAPPRKAQTIEMRYFGGMTAKEIAVVTGVAGRHFLDPHFNFAKHDLAILARERK